MESASIIIMLLFVPHDLKGRNLNFQLVKHTYEPHYFVCVYFHGAVVSDDDNDRQIK